MSDVGARGASASGTSAGLWSEAAPERRSRKRVAAGVAEKKTPSKRVMALDAQRSGKATTHVRPWKQLRFDRFLPVFERYVNCESIFAPSQHAAAARVSYLGAKNRCACTPTTLFNLHGSRSWQA